MLSVEQPVAVGAHKDVEMSDAPAAAAAAPAKAAPDVYARMKALQRQLEFLDIQEEYIKDEMGNLKRELVRAKEEIKRIQSVPLVIGQFLEIIDHNHGIVSSTTGSNYYVRILSTINRELLKPSSSVALHRHSNAVVDVLPPEADSSISMVADHERPDVSYSDIGGCDIQKQESRGRGVAASPAHPHPVLSLPLSVPPPFPSLPPSLRSLMSEPCEKRP